MSQYSNALRIIIIEYPSINTYNKITYLLLVDVSFYYNNITFNVIIYNIIILRDLKNKDSHKVIVRLFALSNVWTESKGLMHYITFPSWKKSTFSFSRNISVVATVRLRNKYFRRKMQFCIFLHEYLLTNELDSLFPRQTIYSNYTN